MDQVAETTHLVNIRGPWADREKQEPPDWQETTHFWGDEYPRGRQRWEKMGLSGI